MVGQYDAVVNGVLALNASLRHDRNDLFEDADTYRVQASYLLPEGTRLRAAAGSGIKNPEYFELYGYSDGRYIGNPDLRPEKSTGWEGGVDQTFLGGQATAGLTYFSSRLKDEIVTEYPPPLFVATPVQSYPGHPRNGEWRHFYKRALPHTCASMPPTPTCTR